MKANKFRVPFFLVLVTLLFLEACNFPDDNLPVQENFVAPTETKEIVLLPTSISSTNTSQVVSDLMIGDVYLRYDGLTTQGTVEALICNIGAFPAAGFVEFYIEETMIFVSTSNFIKEEECASFYAQDFAFGNFPVEMAGTYQVKVIVHPRKSNDPANNNYKEKPITIDMLNVSVPDKQFNAYNQCLINFDHDLCSGEIPHFPLGEPHEVMKISGKHLTIAPIQHEVWASYGLADNMRCIPIMENYLGITAPPIIAERVVVSDFYNGAYSRSQSAVYLSGSEAYLTAVFEQIPEYWSYYLQGKCRNAHELTHFMLGNTPMPHWLNEGLAQYMEADTRSNYIEPPEVQCYEASFYSYAHDKWEKQERPYVNLTANDPSVPELYYYYTGFCLWDYLESRYGQRTLQKVVQETVYYRDPKYDTCSGAGDVLFIRDIVNPIIGEDITPITQVRWGFDETYTGCEHEQ